MLTEAILLASMGARESPARKRRLILDLVSATVVISIKLWDGKKALHFAALVIRARGIWERNLTCK